MATLQNSGPTFTLLMAGLLTLPLVGCGTNRESSSAKEAINAANDPARLTAGISFDRDPDNYPQSGSSDLPVWTGNWWPLAQGGTAARNGSGLSAMEKYDAATGGNSRATNWELHSGDSSVGVSWAGHCNGLAAAGINEKEPTQSVNYHGVVFSPENIKALLVERWQNGNGIPLVGSRCSSPPTVGNYGRYAESGCRDFNPGAFHIILGNMLGIRGKPVIFDIQANEQVWNYPVVGYSFTQSVVTASQAMQAVGTSGGTYNLNPAAALFLQVKTRVKYVTGTVKTYDYIVEGDSSGKIIGGEWLGSSKTDHPDFAWTMSTPHVENPYINPDVIEEIAAASY